MFLINLIPLHVLTLILTGRFSHRIYVAYSTVYTLGTILSMQIPFVGFQPIQSSEHMLVKKKHFIFHSCTLVSSGTDCMDRLSEFSAFVNSTLLPTTCEAD